MIVQCCVCKIIIREKEPLDDKQISHTYCEECLKRVEKEINDLHERKKKRRVSDEAHIRTVEISSSTRRIWS